MIGRRLRDRQVLLVSYWLVVLLLGCSVQFCSYIQMLLLLERVRVAVCIVRCDEIQNNTKLLVKVVVLLILIRNKYYYILNKILTVFTLNHPTNIWWRKSGVSFRFRKQLRKPRKSKTATSPPILLPGKSGLLILRISTK